MSEQKVDAFDAKRNEIKASKSYEKKEATYSEKNYLSTKLAAGQQTKELQFRLIPLSNESEEIFEEVYFHWDNNARKSFVCPKHTKNVPEGTDKECPYCDLEEGYWAEYNIEKNRPEKPENINEIKKDVIYKNDAKIESLKKLALSYKSQSNFVLRGVERITVKDETIDEGPKFWKVAEAVLDNVATAKSQNKKYNIDIFDLKTGKDLLITYNLKDKKSKYGGLTANMVQTPLSEDDAQIKEWVEDDLKWYQVYTIKSFEYMELIISGIFNPWFDKPSGKWIDKATLNKPKIVKEEEEDNTDVEDENVEQEEVIEEVKSETKKKVLKINKIEPDPVEDDLPF